MTDTPRSFRTLPHLALWAIALWVAAGAGFKLLQGSPKDLPEIVRAATPFALPLTYKLVIAIEIALVLLAFLRPRVAWPLLVLLLLVFDAVLVFQISGGDENCGCFGSKISMSPWVMLGIDSGLLLLLLYSKPWNGLFRGAPFPVTIVLAALGATAPWFYDRQVTVPKNPAETAAGTETADDPAVAAAGAPQDDGPKWAILSPEEWVGKSVFDIELTDWLGEDTVGTFPPDGTWIFYRQSCSHCAEHLQEIALNDDGTTYYVLIQVPDDLDQAQEVHMLPAGDHVMEAPLPEGVDYVMSTPADMQVEGYEVIAARENIEHDE